MWIALTTFASTAPSGAYLRTHIFALGDIHDDVGEVDRERCVLWRVFTGINTGNLRTHLPGDQKSHTYPLSDSICNIGHNSKLLSVHRKFSTKSIANYAVMELRSHLQGVFLLDKTHVSFFERRLDSRESCPKYLTHPIPGAALPPRGAARQGSSDRRQAFSEPPPCPFHSQSAAP